MADTVKKSRIVSDDDDNLEEALLEEFNTRLKNCMSKDDLQTTDEVNHEDDTFYEQISDNARPIPRSGTASNDFLLNERQHAYDIPVLLQTDSKERRTGQETDEENIYETLPEYGAIEKTEPTDQFVEKSTPESVAPNLTLDLSPKTEIEDVRDKDVEETIESSYEVVKHEDADRPSFTVETTDFSELRSPEDNAKSVKDRMFLATDDAATLLFTQTVTSPMLTPSEENIDFLKGFQRENTNSDATASNESPPKEDTTKTSEENSTSDISAEMSVSEPLANESPEGTKTKEENIYENAEFLKQQAETVYQNITEAEEGHVYENLMDVKRMVEDLEEHEEHIYQDIDEYVKEDDLLQKDDPMKEDDVYESVGDVEMNQEIAEEAIVENSLYSNESNVPELEAIVTDFDRTRNIDEVGNMEFEHYETVGEEDSTESFFEHSKKVVEHSETVESHSELVMSEQDNVETAESNTEDSLESKTKETYSEFIYHSKTESNYYEKYTEVVSKTATNLDISNREKDTETVPAEIVKNLKSQFSKSGAEVVAITKKDEASELKTVNIMKQINKFEQIDSGDGLDPDDSTVTETYTETTTIQSDVPEEKSLKKKKIKKSRKEEKENISVKSSFSKFDALQKKNVLHIRSSDSTKAQEKFTGAQPIDTTNCKACSKQVFQMEQIKAEKAIWHKNCFRCTECSKQLTVETYVSHEGNLYCKPHFKSLFAPKVVEDETPPSDKPDLGLEELQSLNVKERFQVFEQHQTELQESDRGTAAIPVKRSPSILSKLARFQAKGMDIGVSDDALNSIPIEESSSEEEDEEVPEGEDPTLYKAKKVQKEKPFHFANLSEVKNIWEQGEQSSKNEKREERKQEIQTIRSRLFMGKQGKMKEAYQQAVMQSESCTNVTKSEKIESCDTKSLKERFEKGQTFEKETKNEDDEDTEVFQSEISKKSRSLFLELDANATKAPQLSHVTVQKQDVRKARETDTPEREIYHDPDVVRSEDNVDDSEIAKTMHTASKMLSKFRQMEENLSKEPEPSGLKPLKAITPPPYEPPKSVPDSEEVSEVEEECEEDDQTDNQTLPEDLLEARRAAKTTQFRDKFERWDEQGETRREQSQTISIVEECGEESQTETTKSLRARFESIGSTSSDSPKTQRARVNRFVEIPSITELCESCDGKVYPLEKISVHGHVYHKNCFKCMECSCVLRMDSFSYNQGLLYCTPHFKRLFISKGNYDTAFGLGQHKEKWNINATMA